MKWFKHYSCARSDERISALEDLAGIEGYGFYFKMLEVIAEVMDSSDSCSVTYSLNRWGRQLNITSKKFLTLSQRCSDVGLMTVCRAGDNFTITTPNILKYRDNHTRNLQATDNQEKEKEKEKEKDIPQAVSVLKPSRKKTQTTIPDGFCISDAVKAWAVTHGYTRLDDRLNHFVMCCQAKGYAYSDWDAALRKAITDDWAKLGKQITSPTKPFDMNEFMKGK